MIIRKLFKFENAHIVRNCTTRRCSCSLHGHSYTVEVKLSSNFLDKGGMVCDFGIIKYFINDIIDSFDHAITIWSGDDEEFKSFAKKFSERWIELPVNPSAEQFSRVFFIIIDKLLQNIRFNNNEKEVKLHSIVVHETQTGWAECFREDAYNFENMGKIELKDIKFSPQVMKEWKRNIWDDILQNNEIIPPLEI
ncbi:MAG: 6-carboxytetrahydropterin synthase [Epsilonproteobacteria bacterium]|nr:6-carboxytetrahydropterin synthase [Campylobacterota bacterium]